MNNLHFPGLGVLMMVLACALAPITANALPIVTVSGPDNTGVLLGPGVEPDAAAMAFSISESLTDVSISAPITCVGCTGSVWLHSRTLGSSSQLGDLVIADALTPRPLTAPLFSGVDLSPGLYFLIASIETGFGIWSGSEQSSAQVELAAGATAGPYFTADQVPGFVPFGDFDVVLGGLLHLTVTGNPIVASVPESGSLILLGMAMLGLLVRRKPSYRS